MPLRHSLASNLLSQQPMPDQEIRVGDRDFIDANIFDSNVPLLCLIPQLVISCTGCCTTCDRMLRGACTPHNIFFEYATPGCLPRSFGTS